MTGKERGGVRITDEIIAAAYSHVQNFEPSAGTTSATHSFPLVEIPIVPELFDPTILQVSCGPSPLFFRFETRIPMKDRGDGKQGGQYLALQPLSLVNKICKASGYKAELSESTEDFSSFQITPRASDKRPSEPFFLIFAGRYYKVRDVEKRVVSNIIIASEEMVSVEVSLQDFRNNLVNYVRTLSNVIYPTIDYVEEIENSPSSEIQPLTLPVETAMLG